VETGVKGVRRYRYCFKKKKKKKGNLFFNPELFKGFFIVSADVTPGRSFTTAGHESNQKEEKKKR